MKLKIYPDLLRSCSHEQSSLGLMRFYRPTVSGAFVFARESPRTPNIVGSRLGDTLNHRSEQEDREVIALKNFAPVLGGKPGN